MKAHSSSDLETMTCYISPPHECGYLPDQQAISVFIDPEIPVDTNLYTLLAHQGFRRSGGHLYRPYCQHCRACIAIRIPVTDFQPNRSQRRTWNRNQDLKVKQLPMQFRDEHFRLYRKYISSQHPGGGMDDASPENYQSFLSCAGINTMLYEFRREEELLAVAAVDVLKDGLSAVYTFYDTDQQKRGLGVNAILWEIEETRQQGLDWFYLGYWVRNCRKMNYKTRYRPFEAFIDGTWLRFQQSIPV